MAWMPCSPREQPRYASLQLTCLLLSSRQCLLLTLHPGWLCPRTRCSCFSPDTIAVASFHPRFLLALKFRGQVMPS